MIGAIDIEAALAGRPVLHSRTKETPGARRPGRRSPSSRDLLTDSPRGRIVRLEPPR